MKSRYSAWLLITLTAGIAGCHHQPTAVSADGDQLKVGQTAYARHATIACWSKEELQQAQDLRKQGDKAAFFAYVGGHCGAFDKPEAVEILSIKPGPGDQAVSVKDLDDPAAPAQMWIDSKSLTLKK